MKKAGVLLALGLAGWYVATSCLGSRSSSLSDEQRREVEERVSEYSPARTRSALFLPALAGDAAHSYARARELAEGHVPRSALHWPSHYLADPGARMPASLVKELSSKALRKATDAIVEGTRRPTVTLRPTVGGGAIEQLRLGRGTLLLAIDDYRRGDVRSAVRLALAVQRYANDLSRQSLLNGAIFTDLSREGARAVRVMLESGQLAEGDWREVAGALERLRRDAVSPIDALLGEGYLLDTLILEGPDGDSALLDGGHIWEDALEEYGDDSLRGYAEINGRLHKAWKEAAGNRGFAATGAEDAISACDRLLGAKDRFCNSVVGIFTARAEAELELRDAQIVALTRSGGRR